MLGTGLSLLASTLAGCGSSTVAKTVAAAWDHRFGGDPFTAEQVERLPYATLAARIGNSARAMLVLGKVEGQHLHWISADKGVLVTRHGRLIRSVGLSGGDLANTMAIETDPLEPAGSWRVARRWRRIIDLQPGNRLGLTVVAEWLPVGEVVIPTFWGERTAFHAREVCEVQGKTLTNQFWISTHNGQVIKSEQELWPRMPKISLEILKPYATSLSG